MALRRGVIRCVACEATFASVLSSTTQNRTFAFGPASLLTATVSTQLHRPEFETQVLTLTLTLTVSHRHAQLLPQLTDHLR